MSIFLRRLAIVSLIGLAISSLSGCVLTGNGESSLFGSDSGSGGISVETPLGNQLDVEADFRTFVEKVYTPESEDDMIEGLDTLMKYMTEDEYNSLRNELNYVEQDESLRSFLVHYGKSEDVNINGTKQILDFRIDYGDYNKLYLVEFFVNEQGKIYNHKVWVY